MNATFCSGGLKTLYISVQKKPIENNERWSLSYGSCGRTFDLFVKNVEQNTCELLLYEKKGQTP